MSDPNQMTEAETQRLDWALSEIEGRHTPPDQTEEILRRMMAGNQSPSEREPDGQPHRRRPLWNVLAVAAGLIAVVSIALLAERPPEVVKPGAVTRQDRPLPPPAKVRTSGDIRGLAEDTRNVQGMGLDDDELKVLTRLKKLERLELVAISRGRHAGLVSDDGLELLSSFAKLRELSLVLQSHITDQGLRHLGALPLLESLKLSTTAVEKEGIEELAKRLPNLRRLELHQAAALGDESLEILARMHLLTSLTLRGRTQMTADGLEKLLPKLKNLEHLNLGLWHGNARRINRMVVSDELLRLVARLPKVRVLKLATDNVTSDGLSLLADMKQLEELNLSHMHHVDADVIAKLPAGLRNLYLTGCRNIDDAALEHIATRFTKLRDLDVSYCRKVTNKGVIKLLSSLELHSLKLSGTRITKAVVDPILAEETLEELDMGFSWVTPAMRKKFWAMPRMRKLQAEAEDEITEEAVEVLPVKRIR